jgi:tetratricopeptide (TPR) repeat protein
MIILRCVFILLTLYTLPISAFGQTNYREESKRSYLNAERAMASGDLRGARDGYASALENGRLAGDMPAGAQTAVAQKLARILGNLCERDQAEATFLQAIALAEKASSAESPRTFPVRLELAQFTFDTEQFEKAVTYFEKAFAVGEAILTAKQPVAMAALVDDYAVSLENSGNKAEAQEARKKASALRERGGTSSVVKSKDDYTPYPKTCK